MQASDSAVQERWFGTMCSKTGGYGRWVPLGVTCGTGTHLYALLQVAEDSSFQHKGLPSDDRIWQHHIQKEGLDCPEARGWGKAKCPPRHTERLDFPLCCSSRSCDRDAPAAVGAERKTAALVWKNSFHATATERAHGLG